MMRMIQKLTGKMRSKTGWNAPTCSIKRRRSLSTMM